MNKPLNRRHVMRSTALTLGALAFGVVPARAERAASQIRHIAALVIGMTYASAPSEFHLANTLPDAMNVEKVLHNIPGAQVTLLNNPDLDGFSQALASYLGALSLNDIALIYYAGHGVQIDGQNYMVSGLAEALVPLTDMILHAREKCNTVIVFLDACRNNPFGQSDGGNGGGQSVQIARVIKASGLIAASRSVALGSIPVDSPSLRSKQGLAQFPIRGRGVKIIFSTDPGNVALDGVGKDANSPFNRSLVKELVKLKSLEDVLANVTRDVVEETSGQQTPWSQGSLDEVVYLSGKPKRYESGEIQMPLP